MILITVPYHTIARTQELFSDSPLTSLDPDSTLYIPKKNLS